jgi:hypothetical protein
MWAKLKASCLHSLTIAWGYVLAITGAALSLVDNIGDALGDPSFKDQISAAVGDAKSAGRILLGISVITILARLRTINKGPKP